MKIAIRSILIVLMLLFFCEDSSVIAQEKLPLRVQMVLIKVHPLFEKGQYEQVIAILDKFQSKKKGVKDSIHDHPEINFALGNSYSLLGNPEKAGNYYRQAITGNPEHLGSWQNLAKTEYELENYIEASKAFINSYELTEKKDATLLYYGAMTLLMAEQYQGCLLHFNTLLSTHPDKVTLEWKENLVYALLHADKPRRALDYMVELSNGFTGKKQQQWQKVLLEQYMALNMLKEGLALVHTLTHKDPTVAIWWKGLAHIQLQYERYDKALAALTIYSFLTPLKREEEKLLADLYMQQNIPQKAVIKYEDCVKEKVDEQTLVSLLSSYLSLDRPELALEKLLAFGNVLQEQKRAMLLGEIYYLMKDYKQAAAFYEQATKNKGKETSRAFLMAGYSYWQQGKKKNAQLSFLEAAKEKLFRKQAEKALKQLEAH